MKTEIQRLFIHMSTTVTLLLNWKSMLLKGNFTQKAVIELISLLMKMDIEGPILGMKFLQVKLTLAVSI